MFLKKASDQHAVHWCIPWQARQQYMVGLRQNG
jgi:hypothetical protein